MYPREITHPRDQLLETMDRIYRYRMTTTSGGNISIRGENGDIWITPARVDKGNLTRQDIVRVAADGKCDGQHPASSELPFHRAIYAARPDLRAIVHAHPVALVAFSICRQLPNTRLFHQAHSVCGKLGLATYALPGSEKLGEKIADSFRSGCDSVLLENHGVVIGGTSLPQAFQRFEALEFAAKTLIKARQMEEPRYLTEEQLQLAAKREVSYAEFEPPPPSLLECELRLQLHDFVRRGYRQRLLISTEGSFSARIDEKSLLITPTQKDRGLLKSDDFVLVIDDRAEMGKSPSRATRAHQAIYRRFPSVQAIAFAHPVNATAFSVIDTDLDVRTIPESYVFLREVCRVPYGVQYSADDAIAKYIPQEKSASILENDGVLITGTSILDTFDRLEVLESTCEAIINAQAIGTIQPMDEQAISELRRAFNLR